MGITLVNTYFPYEISMFNSEQIFRTNFRYVFSFSLARQVLRYRRPQFHKSQLKFHNLHEIDAVTNVHNTSSVLNITYLVDEVQQVEYFPA